MPHDIPESFLGIRSCFCAWGWGAVQPRGGGREGKMNEEGDVVSFHL